MEAIIVNYDTSNRLTLKRRERCERCERRTFVDAGEAVLEHGELVDLAELLEHRPQVLVVETARDLADKQLHRVRVLHRYHLTAAVLR